MHFSTTLAAVAAVAPFVSAHGTLSVPKIAGINMRDLKSRDLLATLEARIAGYNAHDKHDAIKVRQDDRQCGPGVGNCAAGQCCSGAGCKLSLICTSNPQCANPNRLRYRGRLLLLPRLRLRARPWLP
jgi:hypothetical protein